MKVLHEKTLKDGRQHWLVELLPGEATGMLIVPDSSFFKLGYPLDNQIVESHHLKEIRRVAWDAYSQEWVDA